MGIRANVHPITSESFDAAMRGDLDLFAPSEALDGTDLDKAWHAIHYLLTGDRDVRFLLTGHDIAAYGGHVEAHSPADVAALQARLASKTNEEILSAFDADLFNKMGIYPDQWDESARSYVAEWLQRFRLVVDRAADNQCGLAVTLA